jgi:hypothetical protein
MWVTQTYLGTAEPDATLFIYYFFEDYVREQQAFTQLVQRQLEVLGEVLGDKVSLLMPNPEYAGRIEAEVRQNLALWSSLRGSLPGLFVSREPLAHLTGRGSGIYIPFETCDPRNVAKVIQRVRGLASDTVLWDREHPTDAIRKSPLGRLFDAIEFKPGIWGSIHARSLRAPLWWLAERSSPVRRLRRSRPRCRDGRNSSETDWSGATRSLPSA